MDSIADKEPAIRKALDVVEYLRQDDTERLLLLRRQMAIHEAISDRLGALDEGRREGRKEALADSCHLLLEALRAKLTRLTADDEQLFTAAYLRDPAATTSAALT